MEGRPLAIVVLFAVFALLAALYVWGKSGGTRKQSAPISKGTGSDAADYAMVRGAGGRVRGVWLRDPQSVLKNPYGLQVLAMRHELPEDVFAMISSGDYRTVPNTYDSAGGAFVMFGSARAPGER